ncbi:MAG: AAA family ATPase, partial [Firmicutes bacterium]|nr:AAA family ATPase [Bacillota bacterium]
FICGGAFDGLERIIKNRTNVKTIGFNLSDTPQQKQEEIDARIFHEMMPQDLIKFGLIPEFVGRLPVGVALDPLDEKALIRILKEPKNSLVKQYQALFGLDDVELTIEDEALAEIARAALERKTGARGLKSIMESVLQDLMFEVPSLPDVAEVVITADAVTGKGDPLILYRKSEAEAEGAN